MTNEIKTQNKNLEVNRREVRSSIKTRILGRLGGGLICCGTMGIAAGLGYLVFAPYIYAADYFKMNPGVRLYVENEKLAEDNPHSNEIRDFCRDNLETIKQRYSGIEEKVEEVKKGYSRRYIEGMGGFASSLFLLLLPGAYIASRGEEKNEIKAPKS